VKNYLYILLITLISPTIVLSNEKSAWKFSATLQLESKYVGSAGGNFYDGPVFQQGLTVSHKSGFYLNVFHTGEASSEFLDNENGFASEMDYTLGWAGKFKGLDLDTGVSYFDMGKTFDRSSDAVSSFFKVSKSYALKGNQSIRPFIKIATYQAVNDEPWQGFRLFTGIGHNWKIDEKLSLGSEISIIYDDGAFGNDSGFIGKLSTSLTYKLNSSCSVTFPRITIYSPLQSLSDKRETEIVIGGGLTINF
jgi:hypothetical protein